MTTDEAQHRDISGPLLSIDGLSIEFTTAGNAACVVDGVSFTVGRGEIVALVGESGSGKSVSGLSMLGLLPNNARASGSIVFDGVELSGYDEKRLRKLRGSRIAMIFQDPGASLDPSFTIGSQLCEAIKLHDRGLTSAACKQRAVELLTTLGITEPERRLTQYPHQLSGGQCQRIMIALALIGEPDLLIADEPTTALDVTVQAEILEVLRDLRDTRDMSILLITHDMGVVADIADRVVVMRHGRVAETQGVDQLFAAPEQDYTKALLAAVPRIGQAVPRATRPEAPAAPVLQVTDLVIEYANRRRENVRAVDGVSVTVARGEIVGLVGESGCGKSSIGRAIVGMTPIAAGTITVSGEEITRLRRRRLRHARRNVGMVFQNPLTSLNPRYSVSDTLEEPLRTQLGLKGTRLRERVDELLTSVGLGPRWRDRYPHELSGGQRQRVAIARGISLDPDLLIADEPTSALDVSVQARVIDLFRELQADLGFGCLFISHDLAVVDSLCDRVAVIRHGQIVEEGPYNQVLSNPAHPYTQNLINSAPVPDPASQRARRDQLRGGRADRTNRRSQLAAEPPEAPEPPTASYR
ncbi:ABC transporter ATP-binding protein [Dactylosporangium fulvum]|uniref:ABC transporter ATP-binding protein n=1 Tax=Dactylosporangium fulvum TaxID=53359 RepID=A0ABY5WAC0_9ACTN|nr:ABC transporter ATP-binding protein [Dactylosporangium fulvum]UWP86439.1 ABC transporter ATP-binding protein [Dactylosporangium fulvum]